MLTLLLNATINARMRYGNLAHMDYGRRQNVCIENYGQTAGLQSLLLKQSTDHRCQTQCTQTEELKQLKTVFVRYTTIHRIAHGDTEIVGDSY